MCILFLYIDPEPKENGYRLIIATNRDEFYKRPAKFAEKIRENGIIGGQDMEPGREGGMWLGISQPKKNNFRFGALLNVTGEARNGSGVGGRGFIVTDYLTTDKTTENYIEGLLDGQTKYNAFNFVVVEVINKEFTTYHSSNVPKSINKFPGKEMNGYSNSTLDKPLQKVVEGKKRFETIITENNAKKNETKLIQGLVDLLKWRERHLPDEELQRRAPQTFEGLSSIYVEILEGSYGTRTHSVILIDYDWNIEFYESSMEEPIDPNDPKWITTTLKSQL